MGSAAQGGRAMRIKTCAKSAKMRQSRDSLASANVERHLALETHVVHLGAQGTEACLNIAQALSVSKLCKSHGQILIPAREAAQTGVAVVTSYTTTKFPIRQEGDQLREHRTTLVRKQWSAPLKPAPEADTRSH